jgi:FtsZ-binding cell division protein ZapB
MKIEVSMGEVLDKITILQIKFANLKDKEKLLHVQHELNTLEESLAEKNIEIPEELFDRLKDINQTLWNTEDIIREKEKNNDFGDEFVKHARLDAKLNDQRFLVKNEINNFYDSNIKEQKSYDGLY